MRRIYEELKSIFWGLALAFVVNTTCFASYYIPSESMVPTLLVGDRLFISKWPYGYSHFSMIGNPPLFEGRIFEHPVARGDVVVFKKPDDRETDVIKRILGLPGDTIQMKHDVLYINGAAVQREPMADLTYRAPDGDMRTVRRYRETLTDGRTYVTLDLRTDGAADNMGPYVVPAGHYFALGDNRDNSLDSRWPEGVGMGFIPAENLVGRAEIVAWSWSDTAGVLRVGRTLTSLR
jgi:signal peptidase I